MADDDATTTGTGPATDGDLADHLREQDRHLEDMQERVDELGESITAAAERAEDDGLLPEDDPADRRPTFADADPGGDDHDEHGMSSA
ncbi:MAG TPA: hypothetical protein VF743_05500 [Acidimicrobiales bacterium]